MCILCIISFGSVVSSLTKRKYSMAEKRQSSSQKRLMQDLFTDKRWINCWAPRFLFNMPKNLLKWLSTVGTGSPFTLFLNNG